MTAQPPAVVDNDAVAELVRSIRKEVSRLERRLKAIARDVERAETARTLQYQAELLSRSKLPKRGAEEIRVIDYAHDPPRELVVPIDPALEPRAQVDAWFKTARRYLRGAELGRARAETTAADISFLRNAAEFLESGDAGAERDALLLEPRIRRFTAPPRPRDHARVAASVPRKPYREFVGGDGSRIWVGRGARDNDALTTRFARSHDLFLHVQGVPGSHVIVPRNKGELVPTELLLDAAHLAHHFSSVASDDRSEVAYVERRYVQKRRGSAPGAVQLIRHKVIHLRVDRVRIGVLVGTEIR